MADDLLLMDEPTNTQQTEELPTGEATEEQPVEEQQPEGEQKPVTSLFQPDGKKLDPQVSAKISEIKKENPSLGKLLNEAVYKFAAFEREFPGGLTEIKELRDKVDELGGVDSIESKIESLAEMDTLAQAFMSGDPAFVEDLVTSSPEAFSAIAPQVFDKYAEANPEGFSSYVARVVLNDMNAKQVPLFMMRFQDLIPADNEPLKRAFEQLNSYLGGFQALAQKQPATVKPKPTAQGDDLSKREEQLRSREWQTEHDTMQKGIVNTEYVKALAGRKPTGEERAQIQELFISRSKKAVDAQFPSWQEKAQRYIQNDDKAGYIRYMKSIYVRVVPEAVASAVRSTLKSGTRPAPKPAGQRPGAPPAKPQAAGFKPVAKEPDSSDIDWGFTTKAMIVNNQAVLRDGSKVAWR